MSFLNELSYEVVDRAKELLTDKVARNENFKSVSTYLSAAPALGIYEVLYPLHSEIGPPDSVENVALHASLFFLEVVLGLVSGYLFMKRPKK